MNKFKDSIILDKVAVLLSATCMLHCLTFPVLLTLYPVLQGGLLEEQYFHAMLLVFVIPASVIALTIGCRKHRQLLVVGIGLVGLVILTLTAFWGHDLFGLMGERIVTSIGGAILATSHILNYRYCRSAHCQH